MKKGNLLFVTKACASLYIHISENMLIFEGAKVRFSYYGFCASM